MKNCIPITAKLQKGKAAKTSSKPVKSPNKFAPIVAALAPMIAGKLMEKAG